MTTLVGISSNDFVVMAADSQITDGDQRIISVETPKIITTGKYMLGLTGDSRQEISSPIRGSHRSIAGKTQLGLWVARFYLVSQLLSKKVTTK
jgi:hypothetical protein